MTENYSSREERRRQQESAKQKRNGNKKKMSKGSLLKTTLLVILALAIIAGVGGAATFAYMVKDTPKLDAATLKASIPSEIYSLDGTFVTEIGTQKLDYVDYENIPELVRNAVIATEDSRFFKHHGIDPIRLVGAVIANVTDGFGAEGGSTITQQVAKMHFLTFEKTISRKAQEAWLAIQLERNYTKEEIFELYVNKVFMSQRATGIATASKIYFGKELKDLTLPEAALIAGMPQSPNNYNPFNHPENANNRKNVVLSLMHKHGFISETEMKEAQAIHISDLALKEEDRQQETDIPYDPFIGLAIKEIEKKYPEINVYSDGLKIYTTLDLNAQDHVDKMMYTDEVIEFPDDKFQAGITLLDTKTGEIRAIGGSRDKELDFGLNYADFPRQPGSTIKPVLDYGPAIEHLKWGTYQTIVDEPYKYSTGQTVNNWDMRHMGAMSIREALARSRNIPAVKALKEVGTDRAKEFANGLGLDLDEEIYEASALGGLEDGVSSLQMAGAFSAFGNNGYYTKPHAVKEVVFRDGTKINMKPETEVAMSDYTAFMISDILKSAVSAPYGTGRAANVPGHHIAGKTGTTNYSSDKKREHKIPSGGVPDIWFVGYNTNYTISVWTGYEKLHTPIVGSDQQLARKIFKELMTHVSEGKETADFTMPNSVQRVKIEKGTAKLASDYTPNDQVAYEYAVKGHVPNEVSQKFKKLEAPSGFSAQYDQGANEVRLSWSSSIEGSYNLSVSVNGGADQSLPSTSENGYRMASPQPGATYTFKLSVSKDGRQSDAVTASVQIPGPENENEAEDQDQQNEDQDQNSENNEQGENNEQKNENNGNNGNPGNNENNGNNGNNGNPGNNENNGNNGNPGNNGNNGKPNNEKPDANREDDDADEDVEQEQPEQGDVNQPSPNQQPQQQQQQQQQQETEEQPQP
ncbi:PBP1A family penicillin-binding protein [Niallia sp. XMNu-256]|uniref:PBP1A family penicillin-binding protein n=1 Tax=Niallia sp. XMNu-256 TaxID=3082444 RepID=UPI0030D49DB1